VRQPTPYVDATVVRAQHPASAHAGDRARVGPDGAIEGFVGGACAEESVRLYALRAMASGEPLLLRILPGDQPEEAGEGYVAVANPCLSGGALEIFLEPHLPAARLVVVGDTPIAEALADLGARSGFAVVRDDLPTEDDTAVVIASHGHGEEDALAAALAAGVPYIGLVASRRRGEAVIASLADGGDRVRTPAGLAIGAVTPEEIAISILAEVVAQRRARLTGGTSAPDPRASVPTAAPAPATAIDPVCGMTVAAVEATLHVDTDDGRVWFCSEHCRAAFAEHAAAG
jgi:xanthine dehydrogenase accessory factor